MLARVATGIGLAAGHALGHQPAGGPNGAVVDAAHDGVAVDGGDDGLPEPGVGELRALEVEAVEPDGGVGLEPSPPVLLGHLVDAIGRHRAPVDSLAVEGGVGRRLVTVEVHLHGADVGRGALGGNEAQQVVGA